LPWRPFLPQFGRLFPLGLRRAFPTVQFQSRDCWARLRAFCTLTQVQQNGVLWYARDPCLLQAKTEPPGSRPPSPGTHTHRNPYVAARAFWSLRFGITFRALSRPSRVSSFSLAAPERWREPHYSAFDRYRRCNSAASLVCMLPLSLQVETEPPGRLPPAPGSHRG